MMKMHLRDKPWIMVVGAWMVASVVMIAITLFAVSLRTRSEQKPEPQPEQPTVIVVEQPAPPAQPVVVVVPPASTEQPVRDDAPPMSHTSPVQEIEKDKAANGNKAEKNKIESGVKPSEGPDDVRSASGKDAKHPDKGIVGSGKNGPWNTERSPDSPKGTGQNGWCTESDYFASGGKCMNYAPEGAKPKTAEARKLWDAQCDYKSGRITASEYLQRTKGLHADEEDPLQYRCS